jgi:hypothetical protein
MLQLKILNGQCEDEMETLIVPVALFELLYVHETHNFKCVDWACNQAGFLQHRCTNPISLQALHMSAAAKMLTAQLLQQLSIGTVSCLQLLGRAIAATNFGSP